MWNGELFKVAAIEPELYCKIAPIYKCCWQRTNQCLVKKQRQTHTIKPEQWPLQSQPAHSKCKGDKTGDTCVADMKQIRPLWRDHYGVETYAMTCKN